MTKTVVSIDTVLGVVGSEKQIIVGYIMEKGEADLRQGVARDILQNTQDIESRYIRFVRSSQGRVIGDNLEAQRSILSEIVSRVYPMWKIYHELLPVKARRIVFTCEGKNYAMGDIVEENVFGSVA